MQNNLPQRFLRLLSVITLGTAGQHAVAQTTAPRCGSELQQAALQNPGFYERLADFQSSFTQWLQTADLNGMETSESGNRIIPVVVHVLHEGGAENISDFQVRSQIEALNMDFQKLNPGLSGLASFPLFDTLVGDCKIEFRLATLDPQGNCTDGIIRVFTPKTENARDWSKFKGLSYWDRAHYYNIWVVKNIYDVADPNTTLGYSQFPYTFSSTIPITSTDGTTLRSDVCGTMGTAPGTGATASHETGHFLGLRHIWGDQQCGNDGIEDTPIQFGPNFSTPTSCHPLPKQAVCYSPTGLHGQDSIDAVFYRDVRGEMWMNFMDYTHDHCLWMFTKGQKAVMDFTFQNYSFRGSLITPANNLLTGTDDAAFTTPCARAPIADFWAHDPNTDLLFTTNLRCAGSTVEFTDGTYNANPTSRNWDFEGGTPSTSTVFNPVITYNTPGIYDVTLISGNANGSSTKSWNDYIRVLPPVADDNNIIYYDDFEGSTSLYEQGKWIEVNEGNTTNRWEQFTSAGYMSSKCMVMKNMDNIKFERDALISPAYNLQTFSNDKLYFRYAYATMTNNPNLPALVGYPQEDKLEVYTSTNCGETWSKRMITVEGTTAADITGTRLITAGLYPNGFVPGGSNEWKEAEVSLGTAVSSDNVRVMFLWTAGGAFGNNFYLDMVNISNSQALGTAPLTGLSGFEVYPNPVTHTSRINFSLAENSAVTISIVDLTGREIRQLFTGHMNAGEQNYQVNQADFGAAGVYMVRLTINGLTSVKKVIVN